MLLKKGMKGQIDLMAAVMQSAANLGSNTPSKETSGTILVEEQNLIQNFKQLFLMLTGNAVQKYGTQLEAHQQVLLGLSDILIEIYFAESALLRTLKNSTREGIPTQETQQAMVQHYVYEAHDIVLKRGKEVILSISEGDEQKQLLEVLNKNCSYSHFPNIVKIKTEIADRFISENSYFL
jgi:hypothetical protein